jgi:type 1 glutamine amidotransferase
MKKVMILLLSSILSFGAIAQKDSKLRVFVFSKTKGYRHKSIPAGLKAITALAQDRGWVVTATEDESFFTDENLAKFDVCVFLNPTGDNLNDEQQQAFERFIAKGKGFVGIHAAADTEYEWRWYGDLCGAFFKTHPPYQQATINIENTNHPAMKPFQAMKTYTVEDEWYSFRENPRGKVTVLATLDENSIKILPKEDTGWRMGYHPIIWYHEQNGARAFYTGFGHGDNAFENEKIQQHIGAAIEWAGKRL